MPKKDNQKMKLLYLTKIFSEETDEEHAVTINELINKLNNLGISAERKSLYDDLECLRNFGLDIVSRRDKTYGYYLASREFEMPELKLLVDAVQASKFITEKKSSQLIKKLEMLTSTHEAAHLQRQVYVTSRTKTANESIYYNVDKIHTAINDNKKIVFKYFEWTAKKEKQFRKGGAEYCVSPWALTWEDENYYLIAYDGDSRIIKHYRVDRMLDMSVCKEVREGADVFRNFDMAVYTKQVFSMFSGEYEFVTMLCKNEFASIIIDRFGIGVNMTPVDKDNFKIKEKVAISPQFLSWIFALSDGVRVVEPQSVIDRLTEMMEKIIKKYK